MRTPPLLTTQTPTDGDLIAVAQQASKALDALDHLIVLAEDAELSLDVSGLRGLAELVAKIRNAVIDKMEGWS